MTEEIEKIAEREKEKIDEIKRKVKLLTEEIQQKKGSISYEVLNVVKQELPAGNISASLFSEVQNMLLETITKGYESIIQEKEKIIQSLQKEVENLIKKYDEAKQIQEQQISRISSLSLEKDKSFVDMLKKIAELEEENKNLKEKISFLKTESQQISKNIKKDNVEYVSSHLSLLSDFITEMIRYFRTNLGVIPEAINIAKEQIGEGNLITKKLDLAIEEFTKLKGILQIAKIRLTPPVVELQKVDLKSTISFALNRFKSELSAKNIEVIEETEAKDTIVNANFQILVDVFSEIIQNSIESFERPAGNRISIKIKEETNKIFVIIEDNGCGIPEHLLSKVFKFFFTTKYQIGHYGVGLFKSYWFLKMFNATIDIRSVFNQGTEVIIQFPKEEL